MLARHQKGNPSGHADGAEDVASTVDDSEEQKQLPIRRENIAHDPQEDQNAPNKGQLKLGELVRQVAGNWPQEHGGKAHDPDDNPGQNRIGSQAFSVAVDQRIVEHGPEHKAE